MDCPRCEGRGQCAECKGTGSITCPTCEGRGTRTTPRGQTYQCRSCSGKGVIDCSPLCSSCEGSGQITSDLQRKIREKYQVRWDNTSPLRTACRILVMINVVIFAFDHYAPPPLQAFLQSLGYNSASGIEHGELWRLITPMFFHGGWVHLVLNCSFLWSYCPRLEGQYGTRRFLVLYFLAGITGNLMSWFGNCYLQGLPWAGIGASTSLMGLSAAFLALHWRWAIFPRDEVRAFAGFPVMFTLASLVFHQYLPIDHWGHLGGFLGGLAFVALTRRPTGR